MRANTTETAGGQRCFVETPLPDVSHRMAEDYHRDRVRSPDPTIQQDAARFEWPARDDDLPNPTPIPQTVRNGRETTETDGNTNRLLTDGFRTFPYTRSALSSS